MILKYYRRRGHTGSINIERLLKLSLPYDYVGFGLTYNPEEIIPALTKNPYKIGYEFKNEVISVRFVDISNISWYKVDYGDEVYEEPLVLIADNNVPEGGIYLDTTNNGIYNLENEPLLISKNDRSKIAETFTEFLLSLKLYQLSNDDMAYCEEIDLSVPANKDSIRLPWED